MKEREYDNLMNEGGEGYNPIRARREQAEFEAEQKRARERALTPQGRIGALHRRIELECGSVAREWGDSEAIDTLQSDLYAQIKMIEKEIQDAFLAEWTQEVTQTRREEWNSMVKSGKFGKVGGGKIDHRAMQEQEQKQGWTMDQLKKAVALIGGCHEEH